MDGTLPDIMSVQSFLDGNDIGATVLLQYEITAMILEHKGEKLLVEGIPTTRGYCLAALGPSGQLRPTGEFSESERMWAYSGPLAQVLDRKLYDQATKHGLITETYIL